MQFISGNLSFRCGRPAKCACCVHMGPIIDCSSSLESHHSAADVLRNAHLKSTWAHHRLQFISRDPSFRCRHSAQCWQCVHICSTIWCITILGTLLSAAGVSKRADIRLFDVFQTISFCSCDGAMAKGSEHLGVEMPPRVVELWNFFQRCVPRKCFLLTWWFDVL